MNFKKEYVNIILAIRSTLFIAAIICFNFVYAESYVL